jgi:hypothetical protein
MTSQWQPFREPLRITMLRTGMIAIVVGAVLTQWWGGLARWPMATILVLWPSLGGHWVEVWFLNWLRPRLSIARGVQVAARVGVWFVGGIGLAVGMGLTADGDDCWVPDSALARLVDRGARLHRHRTGGTSSAPVARTTQFL